jgi:hypothetical protein
MLVVPIAEREFNLYALALPQGPNFDPYVVVSGWKCDSARSVGGVLLDHEGGDFAIRVFRRRVDHCFVVTSSKTGFRSHEAALVELTAAMRPGEPPESIPPGKKKRAPLLETEDRKLGENFTLLTSTPNHIPAAVAVGEIYLAMPNPDDNFVSDFQTTNFDSRLFELYLLAAFREQGVTVLQEHESPDFHIRRDGHECFVEAVTANPKEVKIQGLTFPTFAPKSQEERLLGAPAVRFAKTLRSKIQRGYEKLPQVSGKPFAFAIADFHAPSSMVWSREALPSYLYGVHAKVEIGPSGPRAMGTAIDKLLGPGEIPAGLFRNPEMSYLSAVISSNAATIGKFNRMGFLAGWQPRGLKMTRTGILFDPAPNAVKGRDFEMDILSEEYAALWPRGEQWCQELEVYHNPLASAPFKRDLLPGAIHYFELEGELVFRSMWENTVLSSITNTEYTGDANRASAPQGKERYDYELKLCAVADLSHEDLKRCIAIIRDGGAVNLKTMKRDLPISLALAIARHNDEIIAVGAIKPVRKEYAAAIAAKCKYAFPAETQEVGYVAVDRMHRGRGLSHKIIELLVSKRTGQLFATTDSPRMKKTLGDAGFRQEGQEWEGERGVLSFWEKK